MPTKYKDYPIYTYDEPSTHSDFTGGINTDPSNEHLLENEMRDCVNMEYLSGALVKRKGADILSSLSCDEDITNVQGIFLYTFNLTYIIVAANGKLYYGIYNENVEIKLTRLYIEYPNTYSELVYNPLNILVGIPEYSYEINEKHDGYIQTYFINPDTEEKVISNQRGLYKDISGGGFNIGDIVTYTDGIYLRNYLCIRSGLVKNNITPINQIYWEQVPTEEDIEEWNKRLEYSLGDKVSYNGNTYACIQSHYNFNILPNTENCKDTTLDPYFICIDSDSREAWQSSTYLIFQNYRNIECATLNDKLIVATGTRLVEIYTFNNILKAKPITPYQINNSELINIGFNYLSPYPELNIFSQEKTVTTQIYSVKVEKLIGGTFKLTPIISVSQQDNINDYKFRWEKLIDGIWYCIKSFKSQMPKISESESTLDTTTIKANIITSKGLSLVVDDADKYQYRVTMAKYFDYPVTEYPQAEEWDIYSDYNMDDIVIYNNKYYKCLYSHKAEDTKYNMDIFNLSAQVGSYKNDQYIYTFEILWEELYATEKLPEFKNEQVTEYKPASYSGYWQLLDSKNYNALTSEELNTVTNALWESSFLKFYKINDIVYTIDRATSPITVFKYKCIADHYSKVKYISYNTIEDLKVNETLEVENHVASSILFEDMDIEDTFKVINSCTKILADGYKLLLYNDNYNSGMWYKSIISNPYYITDKGNLSFKTIKNEQVIKVIPFQGNLIVFANSENSGGSIHIVSGNGDDYNNNDGYYSPYQRRTINSSISCDNANTVQVCDNILVFKYFNRIYYINASDLDNEVVKVTPCNDRILSSNPQVSIPWDDNDCVSVVTKDYYGIIWKEKYMIDDNGDLILLHPGLRLKLYYKLANQINDNSYTMPWLKDESDYFNINFILYAKGKPIYLYNNLLLTFDNDKYTDLNKNYDVKIVTRGYDLEYPKLIKLLHNLIIYYHRDQRYNIKLKVQSRNEAGHILISFDDNKKSTQELRVLFANNEKHLATGLRLDATIQDTKVINASYAFPALLADVEIIAETEGRFSLSSVTFNYSTSEEQNMTQFDIYNKIIRPMDLKETKNNE